MAEVWGRGAQHRSRCSLIILRGARSAAGSSQTVAQPVKAVIVFAGAGLLSASVTLWSSSAFPRDFGARDATSASLVVLTLLFGFPIAMRLALSLTKALGWLEPTVDASRSKFADVPSYLAILAAFASSFVIWRILLALPYHAPLRPFDRGYLEFLIYFGGIGAGAALITLSLKKITGRWSDGLLNAFLFSGAACAAANILTRADLGNLAEAQIEWFVVLETAWGAIYGAWIVGTRSRSQREAARSRSS
jgi:hypothetical protein